MHTQIYVLSLDDYIKCGVKRKAIMTNNNKIDGIKHGMLKTLKRERERGKSRDDQVQLKVYGAFALGSLAHFHASHST